jgi:hypothetical protein
LRPHEPRPACDEAHDGDWYDVSGDAGEQIDVDFPRANRPFQRPVRDVEEQEPRKIARSCGVPSDLEENAGDYSQAPDDLIQAENVRFRVCHFQESARFMLIYSEG